MGMMRQLFRPGVGDRHERYVSAFMNGATAYSGDLVHWDYTAPTSQTFNGATDTLGANDFIYVIHAPGTVGQGSQAGVLQGDTVTRKSASGTANLLDDNQMVVVQTWGVAADVWMDTTQTAGGLLLTGATTGEFTAMVATDIATLANGTESAIGVGHICGVAMTASATTHVRGTATTEEGVTAFIRCDF